MIVEFEKLGVTREMIENRLSRSVETMNGDDLADFIGIYNSLKEGQTKISAWFEYETFSDLSAELEAAEKAEVL